MSEGTVATTRKPRNGRRAWYPHRPVYIVRGGRRDLWFCAVFDPVRRTQRCRGRQWTSYDDAVQEAMAKGWAVVDGAPVKAIDFGAGVEVVRVVNPLEPSEPSANVTGDWDGGWIAPDGTYYANPHYAAHADQADLIWNCRYGEGYVRMEEEGWAHIGRAGGPRIAPYSGKRLTNRQRAVAVKIALAAEPYWPKSAAMILAAA